MKRSYYSNKISNFLQDSENHILAELVKHHEFVLEDLQRNAWIQQIRILKNQLKNYDKGFILFEYSIPRMGKRVDIILLLEGTVFVLEFKIGEKGYPNHALEQVIDYSLDLKNFHDQSHHRIIIPILVSSEAPLFENDFRKYDDNVFYPFKANKDNLNEIIYTLINKIPKSGLNSLEWETSIYKPTPTIIEAAQALYQGHNIQDISRSDSGAINLSKTSEAINEIIESSKKKNQKSICFITGVPGAGKTLAGLNIANERQNFEEEEHTVFLSGNGPLVKVLQEALARNDVSNHIGLQTRITKREALSKTKAFIQNIHHFRDDMINTNKAPIEKVVIFDEAQRAWDIKQTNSFMKQKKGIQDFKMSEPEFLISVMDRHNDWSIIICLIGGGQEINIGEAGLTEWFKALGNHYHNWHIYVSDKLRDIEYTNGNDIYSFVAPETLHIQKELHLSVSVRSFRSERVSHFVKALLDINKEEAKFLWSKINKCYEIRLTRNIEKAKKWLKNSARGSERIGMIASSGAYRLKPYGINTKIKIDPIHWFLNDKDDVRSSYFLEDVATEFDIQGLELDWTCVCWDADLRFNEFNWEYKRFKGTKWENINDEYRRQYLKNAYRVLLTRARQGMIVFVPEGDNDDVTRKNSFYDSTFNYLKEIGLPII